MSDYGTISRGIKSSQQGIIFLQKSGIGILAGQQPVVDLTGGLVLKGDAYWSVPNSARPLDVILSATKFTYPFEDMEYDVQIQATLVANVADAGKTFGIYLNGNQGLTIGFGKVSATGNAIARVGMVDACFVQDLSTGYGWGQVFCDCSELAQNSILTIVLIIRSRNAV